MDAVHSPSTAPVTAKVAASFSAEKSGVSVAGRRMCSRMRRLFAPIARASAIASRSTLVRPPSTLTTTGKKMNSPTITIFGKRPKPSQITSAAPIAMIGTAWLAISTG